jgi:carboxypeptidase C (cathepsin A)
VAHLWVRMCCSNHVGNRRWVDALQWEGSSIWAAAERQDWVMDREPAGSVTEAGPLSFVEVYEAGHMVGLRLALPPPPQEMCDFE